MLHTPFGSDSLPKSIPLEEQAKHHFPIYVVLLFLVGCVAFVPNLFLPLRGDSEGLYASVAREMSQSGSFFHLTYQGEAYGNKPPLLFWVLHFSVWIFGENEFAFKLPGVLFCFGIMGLTYALGKNLFSSVTAFWATLSVSTSFILLWYGPRLLFDAGLTFFITLSLFAWSKVQFHNARQSWLLLSFFAMALGVMWKAWHALLFPALAILAFMVIQRDFRIVRRAGFWIGLCVFAALVVPYHWLMNDAHLQRMLIVESVNRVFQFSEISSYFSGRPIYWYLGLMWVDFFPWSVVLPLSLYLLYQHKPFREHPKELFLLIWVGGFLLLLSLAQVKREPYLLPMLPGIGLMVGYYFHSVFSGSRIPGLRIPFNILLSLLCVIFLGFVFAISLDFQARLYFPPSAIPVWYRGFMIVLCGLLLWTVIRKQQVWALRMTGVLAAGFAIGFGLLIVPAIAQFNSTATMKEKIHMWSEERDEKVFLHLPNYWPSYEMIYYLELPPSHGRPYTEEHLWEHLDKTGTLIVLTSDSCLPQSAAQRSVSVSLLETFPQRSRKLWLVALEQLPTTPQNATHSASAPACYE